MLLLVPKHQASTITCLHERTCSVSFWITQSPRRIFGTKHTRIISSNPFTRKKEVMSTSRRHTIRNFFLAHLAIQQSRTIKYFHQIFRAKTSHITFTCPHKHRSRIPARCRFRINMSFLVNNTQISRLSSHRIPLRPVQDIRH